MDSEKEIIKKHICEIEVVIKNEHGLHMRPSMQFVDIASQFDCDITVSNNEISVDGKSIMYVTMLAATMNTKLKIIAKGVDAKQAINALRKLVEEILTDKPISTKV